MKSLRSASLAKLLFIASTGLIFGCTGAETNDDSSSSVSSRSSVSSSQPVSSANSQSSDDVSSTSSAEPSSVSASSAEPVVYGPAPLAPSECADVIE